MTFANPFLLYTIPILLIAIIIGFYFSERKYQRLIQHFSKIHLQRSLFSSYSKTFRRFKQVLIILGIASILLALARPQWGHSYLETKSKGIDILFALDVSQSMLAQDLKPNRLERSKLAIYDFIEQLQGDRIGLIAFAGNAFLQCPLTLDYNAFTQTLESLNTNIISTQGTDIASAITEAERTFQKNNKDKILILITDGEDLEGSGLQKAIQSHKEGLKIYTVGVGTQEGDIIPIKTAHGQIDYLKDSKGKIVKTALETKTLQAIAQATDGYFTVLGKGGDGLQTIYNMIQGDGEEQEFEAHLQKIPHEQFQWFLGGAIFCLLLEKLIGSKNPFSKKRYFGNGALGLLLITSGFLLSPNNMEASTSKAYQAYNEERYQDAVKLYQEAIQKHEKDNRYHYNLGSSYYQTQNYKEAFTELNTALQTNDTQLQEKVFYNLGNTQYQLGQKTESETPEATIKQWEEAITQYENTLELNPNNEKAKHNLDFVKQRLEELKKKQQEQQQQNSSKDHSEEPKEQNNPQNSNESKEDSQKNNPENNKDKKNSNNEENKNEQNKADKQDASDQPQEGEKQKKESSSEKQNQQSEQNRTPEGSDKQENQPASTQDQDHQQSMPSMQHQEAQPIADPGAMSKKEAAQLLDASQNSEKTLLLNIQQGQNPKAKRTPTKNW